MKLIIVRHGEAEFHATSDANRNLTERGRNESRLMGTWLGSQFTVNKVLVSPYNRAQQTYQEMRDVGFACGNKLDLTELTPDADPATAENIIRAYMDGVDTLLVVAHLPLVSYLVELFTRQVGPIFATAGCAVIELEHWQAIGELENFKAPFQIM